MPKKNIVELSKEEQDECERVSNRILKARKEGGLKAGEQQFLKEINRILKF